MYIFGMYTVNISPYIYSNLHSQKLVLQLVAG